MNTYDNVSLSSLISLATILIFPFSVEPFNKGKFGKLFFVIRTSGRQQE